MYCKEDHWYEILYDILIPRIYNSTNSKGKVQRISGLVFFLSWALEIGNTTKTMKKGELFYRYLFTGKEYSILPIIILRRWILVNQQLFQVDQSLIKAYFTTTKILSNNSRNHYFLTQYLPFTINIKISGVPRV